MSIIYFEEITSGYPAVETPGTFKITSGGMKATLENLDPKRTWTVAFTITPTGQSTVAVQGNVKQTAVPATLTFTIDPSEPATIEIVAPIGTIVQTEVTPSGSLEDTSRFALLAYVPKPEYKAAILGQAILGQFTLPNPKKIQKGLILGQSFLGAATLAANPTLDAWQNILSPATEVEVTRGVEFNGLTTQADTGTLTVNIYNALDPRASTLRRGTPLRLVDTKTRRALFIGKISRAQSTPAKDGTYTVTLTALDGISDLAQVAKYQDTSPSSRTWNNAIGALLDGRKYTLEANNASSPLISGLVQESTLVTYLDTYCATVGASWMIDRLGIIRFTDRLPAAPGVKISDRPDPGTISPVMIEAAFDTDSIITGIEATNHIPTKDGSTGEWSDQTTTISITDATLTKAYGSHIAKIDTAAVSTTALRDHLRALMAKYVAAQTVKAAEFCLIKDGAPRTELDAILTLDLLDAAQISYRNSTATVNVSRIKYHLTPFDMTAHLEFITLKH